MKFCNNRLLVTACDAEFTRTISYQVTSPISDIKIW